MLCPICKKRAYVIDTRTRGTNKMYRRYNCDACGFRFSTFETYAKDYVAEERKVRAYIKRRVVNGSMGTVQ